MAAPALPAAPVLGALRSRARRLVELAVTPLVPSDYVDLLDPLRSGTDLRARVVEVRPETRDAATLVLRPGRTWRGHRAGQYVRVGVDVDGVRQWRSYSTTAPAGPDGLLSITVKAQGDGTVSPFLVRRARPGLVVQLEQAAGEFVLPDALPAAVLFVTAGSGLTPVMGMLREAGERLGDTCDVVVVHSDRTPEDVLFGDELRELAASGRVRLVERHTTTDGRLTVDELRRLVPDLAEREAWACGPGELLDALEAHWSGATGRLRTERFRPVLTVPGEGGTARFARTGTVVEADGSTPLLVAGEEAGVLLPSGCRMGICFGCVLPLRSGAVRDLRSGDVTTAGEGVLVQTCVSAAAGPCELDA